MGVFFVGVRAWACLLTAVAPPGWTRSDGNVFDSSVKRGEPFDFTLGQGMVIRGWDNGLQNMCVGERRRLTIPSNLGYGDHGSGARLGVGLMFPLGFHLLTTAWGSSIPGGATLVFDVELLAIKNADNNEL